MTGTTTSDLNYTNLMHDGNSPPPCRYPITANNNGSIISTATQPPPVYAGCEICKNLTVLLLGNKSADLDNSGERDDSRNAFLYIVFVLLLYACSIAILMIKYVRKEREGTRTDDYYDEFVKREKFQNLAFFDKQGRPIQYLINPSLLVSVQASHQPMSATPIPPPPPLPLKTGRISVV